MEQRDLKVLVIGATGFIGRHVTGALTALGCRVLAAGRSSGPPGGAAPVKIDLAHDSVEALKAALAGVEVVVNCAGLVRNQGANTMARVHAEGMERLLQACRDGGIRRLIHISALGVSTEGGTAYQETKGVAEAALHRLGKDRLDWCILRPSLVVGRGGASTSMLTALAALPWPPRLGDGTWEVQPVHVDDLSALVVRLVRQASPLPRSIDVVGPQSMTTDQLTTIFRAWLGLPNRPFLPVPASVLNAVAAIGERIANGPANRDVLSMLRQGIRGDMTAFAKALGRLPTPLAAALARHPACRADRQDARLYFLRAPLRWSLGLLWLITGLLSFGLYPMTSSLEMLAHLGASGTPALVLLYGAAALDVLLGSLLFVRCRPVAVGGAQLAVMVVFTLLAVGLPTQYWLHPFAPLLKNLPLALATAAMMALEKET